MTANQFAQKLKEKENRIERWEKDQQIPEEYYSVEDLKL
jgi:ribosome-binding protein aMBF1 (putative translation factor)